MPIMHEASGSVPGVTYAEHGTILLAITSLGRGRQENQSSVPLWYIVSLRPACLREEKKVGRGRTTKINR